MSSERKEFAVVWSQLQELCNRDHLVFRGQADATWRLESSIDRAFRKRGVADDQAIRQAIEQELKESFNSRLAHLLPTDAYFQWARALDQEDSVWAWQIMQHYGYPTRLLDWTRCPFIAALNASAGTRHENSPGAVWWFDLARWEQHVSPNWDTWGVQRKQLTQPNGETIRVPERDFEPIWKRAEAPPFVVHFSPLVPFPRIRLQRGLHTASSKLGLLHDDVLCKWLGNDQDAFGKIIIPAPLKIDLVHEIAGRRQFRAGDLDMPLIGIEAREAADLVLGRTSGCAGEDDGVPRHS